MPAMSELSKQNGVEVKVFVLFLENGDIITFVVSFVQRTPESFVFV